MERQCRQFYYGGCKGNGNNFETHEACMQSCERVAPAVTAAPSPEAPPETFSTG